MSISDLMVLRGRVGTNLTLSRPEDGERKSFSRFRMVVPRSRRKDDGKWEDTDPEWYTVRAWGTLAENLAMSLRKGNPVVVIGRPAAHAWVGGDGELRSEVAINAFTAGHDLGFGASLYRRVMLAQPNTDPKAELAEKDEPGPAEEAGDLSGEKSPLPSSVETEENPDRETQSSVVLGISKDSNPELSGSAGEEAA